ncbi:MAG: radical SAM protein [Candidatus Sigynarchaeota archaeon]
MDGTSSINDSGSGRLDILMVAPPYSEIYGYLDIKIIGWYNPPLGIAYIQSYVKKHGFKSRILDMVCYPAPWNELARIIREERPKIVGISCTTPIIPMAKRVATIAKKIDNDIKIVLGGSHPTALIEKTMEYSWVDIVVFGEGEQTVLELLQGKALDAIPGLAFKQNGKIIINEKRQLIENLDELPFPDVSDLRMEKYKSPWLGKQTNVQMSRGCPYNCTFCASIITWDRKYRVRSVKSVIKELKFYIRKYGIRSFSFNDDTFTASKRIVLEFCNAVVKERLKIKWDCLTRLDCVDEEILRAMKRANCKVIRYGIEYGNQRELDRVQKQLNKAKISETLKMTRKVGIQSYGFFIIGQPHSTRRDILDTIQFSKSLPLDYAQFAMIVPLPGTKVWFDCQKKDGIELVSEDWKMFGFHNTPAIKIPGISPEMLVEYYRMAYKQFYFRISYIIRRFLHSLASGQILRDIMAFMAFLLLLL